MTIRSLPFLSLLILACNEPVELGARDNPHGGAAGQTSSPNGTGGASISQTTGRVPVCGDGLVEAPEQCDDGNTGGGDGCSASCTLIESGWQCETQGQPCVSTHCGNHVIETALGEQCDDGADNGGISACGLDCLIDINWKPPASCGNGAIDPGEECDDGNRESMDGCTVCRVEKGWTCSGNSVSICVQFTCGNGVVEPTEQCDDGLNNGGYGACGPDCTIGPRCGDGKVDAVYGEQCDDGVNDGSTSCGPGCQLSSSGQLPATCGNGVIDRYEQCDDGNRISGDGCTVLCQLEKGWTCSSGPATHCVSVCGDGVVAGAEQCDLGMANNDGGYGGCTAECKIGPYCGDGVVEPENGEQCDDGINDGGYGECAPGCKIGPHCGDGVIDSLYGEQCDGGSGCTEACKIRLTTI